MPQKPTKWGIKLYSLADSLNGYILDIHVYTGSETQTNPVYSHLPKTTQIVTHLVTPFLDSEYHLYTDIFYFITTLSETLESRNTHFTGTVNNNRKDLPDVIRSTPSKKFSLPAGGYKAYHCGRSMIAAWRPKKKKKNMFMLSTGYTSKLTAIPWISLTSCLSITVSVENPSNVTESMKKAPPANFMETMFEVLNCGTISWLLISA